MKRFTKLTPVRRDHTIRPDAYRNQRTGTRSLPRPPPGLALHPLRRLGHSCGTFHRQPTGEATAVASLTLDTTVHDLVVGGDRGLRIFEAQEMTSDTAFRDEVRAAIGDPDFDFGRFAISLSPISVADGISRGILTVSDYRPRESRGERYRQAFVDVFITEYTAPDGLCRPASSTGAVRSPRTTPSSSKRSTLSSRPGRDPLGINIDLPLVDVRGQTSPSTLDYEQQAQLRRELAEVEGAIGAIAGISDGAAAAVAGSVLGQPVAAGDAASALAARKSALEAAIEAFAVDTVAFAESKLDRRPSASLTNSAASARRQGRGVCPPRERRDRGRQR